MDRTGQFGLGPIPGRVGRWIRVGQWVNGAGGPHQHTYMWVSASAAVEAMPGGAVQTSRWADLDMPFSHFELPTDVRGRVIAAAQTLVGTPYSFLDYLSLALARLRVRPRWLRDYVADTGHMICSQLCDEAYQRAGVHLYDDGRIPGDVTPGHLWRDFIKIPRQPAWLNLDGVRHEWAAGRWLPAG